MSAQGDPPAPAKARGPGPGQTLGAMWLYTVLRFGLFLALWGLLWIARVPGLLAATIALVLSIPLSYILLRKQRAKLAANLEARVIARQAQRHTLDAQLAGENTGATGENGATSEPAPRPVRPKRRAGGSAEQ
ncbi:DUF4229 domain-containing protein [Jatrophihabitans sp.]|uniref:DUF4229 domain-containing protein n=1 Tax=Jatrophihabitans sp. TaxID=1932789 RepID=UPI002BE2081E|nr:DUF4229 domain-containing protein [Jatrophihabitans sp.]